MAGCRSVAPKKGQDRAPQGRLRRILRSLGPGLITGASDDDPSGIGTYSQAGAQLGYGIGWTMLLTFPLMAAIQEISARIGRTTGHGIAGILRRHYPNWLLHHCRAAVPRQHGQYRSRSERDGGRGEV
jgi:Mn2+/Fe2+ NRAMP family transporter